MSQQPKPTKEQRELLKRYLDQYLLAKDKQRVLRERLAEIRAEFDDPSTSHPGKPPRKKSGVSSGAASPTFKLADIEERIRGQTLVEETAIFSVMEIIDELPPDSMEKYIMELRHIDGKPWKDIPEIVHLSRSPCFEYYNRGLDRLLSTGKTRVVLSEFKSRISRE